MPTYRFVAWLDEAGTPVATEPIIDLVVEGDFTLTANYEIFEPTYQLSLASDKTDYYVIENVLLSGVLLADGSPVAGARITLNRNGLFYMETTTLIDGSYSFVDSAPIEGIVEYQTEYVAELIFRSNSIIVRRA